MQIRKTTGSALLLFALTAAAANAAVSSAEDAVPSKAATRYSSGAAVADVEAPPTIAKKAAKVEEDTIAALDPTKVNKDPGRVDAPVDGLDGKPHNGPGLFELAEKGTGDVGISGGKTHVDIKNPPPHTGDHEIVDLEEGTEGDDHKAKVRWAVDGRHCVQD